MIIKLSNSIEFADRLFVAIEAKADEYTLTEKAIDNLKKEGKRSEYLEQKLDKLLDDIDRISLSLPGGDNA